MIENNRNNEQIYGRNDMIMLDQNNEIYGSLGLADKYVMKTEEGTKLILSNPKLGSFDDVLTELNIYGMSKQVTTTGKSLINADEYYSQFKQSDGTYKLKTVILNDIRISLSEFVGKEITLSVKLTVGANTSAVYLMYISSEQKKINGSVIKSGLTGKSILTVTPVSNTDYFVISFGSGNDDVTFSELQLELGSVATSYEPYTGGQPSPSPEYPQEIISAGNSGNIEVNVRGKNLVDVYGYSANDIPNPEAERVLFNIYGTTLSTTEKTDKLIVHQEIIDGATANNYTSGYFCIGINRKLETGKDYIITFNINVIQNPFSVSTVSVLFNGIEVNKAEVIGDKATVKVKCKEYRERQYVEVRNAGMSLEISNFMITEKDENTIYEPYYEPQTISINTPTGLPAIPVDTDGNYTDANGQQWIADYIDLKRGKYVQWIGKCNLENLSWRLNDNMFHSSEINNSKKYEWIKEIANLICSHYVCNMTAYNMNFNSDGLDNLIGMYSKDVVIKDTRFNKDVELFKKSLNGVYVYYVLNEPIERDLTPSEIQAYQELTTYAGTTIVENNYNTWMKATYKSTESV